MWEKLYEFYKADLSRIVDDINASIEVGDLERLEAKATDLVVWCRTVKRAKKCLVDYPAPKKKRLP
jgi:hypothetical protein